MFDFENKVLEDILEVTLGDCNIKKAICTDKVDRIKVKNNIKYYPLIFEKDNIYAGLEKKIAHYYKYITKYNRIGIDNVDQFLCIYMLESGRLFGKKKRYALWIQDYILHRDSYIKMGFLTVKEYLEYKIIFSKNKDTRAYSEIKEYENNKEYYMSNGVFSLGDFMKFNDMIKKSIFVYEHSPINRFMNISDYLSFETREFTWKKEYFAKHKSLIGVQQFIKEKYEIPFNINNIPYSYFDNTGYYAKKFNIKNYSEYYNWDLALKKVKNNVGGDIYE